MPLPDNYSADLCWNHGSNEEEGALCPLESLCPSGGLAANHVFNWRVLTSESLVSVWMFDSLPPLVLAVQGSARAWQLDL